MTAAVCRGSAGPIVRTFDAPEALNTRFHEVYAQVGDQPRAGRVADAVPLDDQPVPRLHATRCTYCFARPTHEYLDFNAGRDFEREIVVKVNLPEVLRAELAQAVVDGRARRAWDEHGPVPVGRAALRAHARDLGGDARLSQPLQRADQVAAAAARCGPASASSSRWPTFSACLSIPTLDEKAWRATEPHTPHPRKRIEAVAELDTAGHPCERSDRAADAGDQRLRRAGAAARRGLP